MRSMQLALVIAVALFVVGVAAWPLIVARHRASETTPVDGDAAHSRNRAADLEAVYDAIRTLQTEHGLGRISDADFREQRAEYRREAAQILRNLEISGGVRGRQGNGD